MRIFWWEAWHLPTDPVCLPRGDPLPLMTWGFRDETVAFGPYCSCSYWLHLLLSMRLATPQALSTALSYLGHWHRVLGWFPSFPSRPTQVQCPHFYINDFLQCKCHQALLCLKHIDHFHGLSEEHANSLMWPPKVCMEGCGLSPPGSERHLPLTTKLSCHGNFVIFTLWLTSPFLCLIVFLYWCLNIMFYNFGAICNQFPPFKKQNKTHKNLVYSSLIIIGASLVAQLVKKSTCNAGVPGSIPGSGRYAGEGIGYPLQYSWANLHFSKLFKIYFYWSKLPK